MSKRSNIVGMIKTIAMSVNNDKGMIRSCHLPIANSQATNTQVKRSILMTERWRIEGLYVYSIDYLLDGGAL